MVKLSEAAGLASAGSKPAGHLHPFAIAAMQEIGIDISTHRSKHLDEFASENVKTLIIVCDNADQACPMYPGQANRHHRGVDDTAHVNGTDEEQMRVFQCDTIVALGVLRLDGDG